MFVRQMMISGLEKQRELLKGLILEIENKSQWEMSDWNFCNEKTKRVANNLRRLRKIKSDYAEHLDFSDGF